MNLYHDWLPQLTTLNDYGGDWDSYLAALYEIFSNDFLSDSITFDNRRCNLKRHPIAQGKEATFWHLIQKGKIEEDRVPDFRRCERIGWPKAILENYTDPSVKMWKNNRGPKAFISLLLVPENYLVVLADRNSYLLLWTAYWVGDRSKERLLKEHSNYWSSAN